MKKMFSLAIALAFTGIISRAQDQLSADAVPAWRQADQSSKDAESREYNKSTDEAVENNGIADQGPGIFSKDKHVEGLSLDLRPAVISHTLIIDIRGGSDLEYRAVLMNASGDIVGTRVVRNGYEWDLYVQPVGSYRLVLLSRNDGSLLARRQFVKK